MPRAILTLCCVACSQPETGVALQRTRLLASVSHLLDDYELRMLLEGQVWIKVVVAILDSWQGFHEMGGRVLSTLYLKACVTLLFGLTPTASGSGPRLLIWLVCRRQLKGRGG